MPEQGKKTLTINEQTHYEITLAAKQAKRLVYVFVDEIWDSWKRKGKALPAPVIHFEGPKPEEGFKWIKVPEKLAPRFERLVELFGQDPRILRSMLEMLEASKNTSR